MAGYNSKVRAARIESFLDPEFLGIDATFWPSKADFTAHWETLGDDQRLVVAAAINVQTFGKLMDELARSPAYVAIKLRREKKVGIAILMARMCQLHTDAARELFIDGFLGAQQARRYYFEEVQKVIKTDKDHLTELAAELVLDGDGKRGVFKQLIAYGMQVKKVEDAEIHPDTGVEICPMVIALADPRMAFNALQELNRMDHEYGDDNKATSSIESQAERLRRLSKVADQMNTAAAKQAKTVGAVARKVATRELQIIDDNSGEGV